MLQVEAAQSILSTVCPPPPLIKKTKQKQTARAPFLVSTHAVALSCGERSDLHPCVFPAHRAAAGLRPLPARGGTGGRGGGAQNEHPPQTEVKFSVGSRDGRQVCASKKPNCVQLWFTSDHSDFKDLYTKICCHTCWLQASSDRPKLV